jgi:hypothetical protein
MNFIKKQALPKLSTAKECNEDKTSKKQEAGSLERARSEEVRKQIIEMSESVSRISVTKSAWRTNYDRIY